MQCAIEIHSAAKLYVVHVRSATRTGARSALYSGLDAISRVVAASSSTRPSACSTSATNGLLLRGARGYRRQLYVDERGGLRCDHRVRFLALPVLCLRNG
jgi:hypothetical protein